MESLVISTASSFIFSQLTGKLLTTIQNIISMKISHPDVNAVLIKLDIEVSLSIIEGLLKDLEPLLPKCGCIIKVCFENLNNKTINKIQILLENIEKKCNKHKKSWSVILVYK